MPSPTPYMHRLRDLLRTTEPELWAFFASAAHVEELATQARSYLLRSTYRLEEGAHGGVLAAARTAAERLGVTDPVVIYQAREGTAAQGNAHIVSLPGQAHIVFSGGTLELLDPDELLAVLGHELAHHVLWALDGGDFWVLDRLVSASAEDPEAQPVHEETARLLSLNTELVADRGALIAVGGTGPATATATGTGTGTGTGAVPSSVDVAVAALVKLDTGLRTVSGAAYLRQADEILTGQDAQRSPSTSAGSSLPDDADPGTHPDGYLRAWALSRWAAGGAAAEAEIARRIVGPLELTRLDLVGQHALTDLAQRLIRQLLEPAWARTDASLAHARQFGAGALPGVEAATSSDHLTVADLAALGPSAIDFLAYVLLDLATVDDDLREPALASALLVSADLAIADRFDELVATELGLTRAEVRHRRQSAASALATAGATA